MLGFPELGVRGWELVARDFNKVSIRPCISLAALLVKVTARISPGCTPLLIRLATRWVNTRVLPLPAPASTRTGPDKASTAAAWCLLSPENITSLISVAECRKINVNAQYIKKVDTLCLVVSIARLF